MTCHATAGLKVAGPQGQGDKGYRRPPFSHGGQTGKYCEIHLCVVRAALQYEMEQSV